MEYTDGEQGMVGTRCSESPTSRLTSIHIQANLFKNRYAEEHTWATYNSLPNKARSSWILTVSLLHKEMKSLTSVSLSGVKVMVMARKSKCSPSQTST